MKWGEAAPRTHGPAPVCPWLSPQSPLHSGVPTCPWLSLPGSLFDEGSPLPPRLPICPPAPVNPTCPGIPAGHRGPTWPSPHSTQSAASPERPHYSLGFPLTPGWWFNPQIPTHYGVPSPRSGSLPASPNCSIATGSLLSPRPPRGPRATLCRWIPQSRRDAGTGWGGVSP